jgi:hypothetical protein
MRLTRTAPLAALVITGALASPAGATVAQDLRSPDAANPPQTQVQPRTDLRSPDTVDATQGRSPRTVVAPPVVQVTSNPVHADGFDWGDAGIGAAGALGLIAISLGATVTLRHRHPAAAS